MSEQLSGEDLVALLAELSEGGYLEDAAAELSEVLDAVKATDKKGSLQLTISAEMFDDVGPGAMVISGAIRGCKPVADAAKVLHWENGQLTRHDPRQATLDDAKIVSLATEGPDDSQTDPK